MKKAQLKAYLQLEEAAKKGKMTCEISTYRGVVEILQKEGFQVKPKGKTQIENFSTKCPYEVYISWKLADSKIGRKLKKIAESYCENQNKKKKCAERKKAIFDKVERNVVPKWTGMDFVPYYLEQLYEIEKVEVNSESEEELIAWTQFVCRYGTCKDCPITDKCKECNEAVKIYGEGFLKEDFLMRSCCSEKNKLTKK